VVLATRDRRPDSAPVAKATDLSRPDPTPRSELGSEAGSGCATGSGSATGSSAASGDRDGSDVVAVAPPTDGSPGDEGSAQASSTPGAPLEAQGPRPGASAEAHHEARDAARARRAEIAKLLAEAEEAKRTRSLVRWVLRADAALRLDPRSAKARLLLAEGLIASGDLERGCKYLHDLRRNPSARTRAAQAGCPTD
jgi:hypothetical protein